MVASFTDPALWGWLLTLGLLIPLVWFQRRLHGEVQAVFLVLTRSREVAIFLFALLFFPGVLLHELSHFLMAQLLGVRTGRLSFVPRLLNDGTLRMGYVETQPADWFSEALIGAAPLLSGGLFVAYAGLYRLGLLEVWSAWRSAPSWAILGQVVLLTRQADFWLWLYLTVVVSSTMLPSASDRRAWLPLALVGALLLGVVFLAGAGPWLTAHLAPLVGRGLQALSVVFAISLLVHAVLLVPLTLMRRLLAWGLGVEVML